MNFVNGGIFGADVSHWQDVDTTPQQINFEAMVDQKASFVIIRAGQGSLPDPDFIYNFRNARVVGLPRGSYWFYDSRYAPEKQAELFASMFQSDKPELELWLDLEERYGGPYAGVSNWKKFLNRLTQLLPQVRVGIYTSFGYMAGVIPAADFDYFSRFPLWLASYNHVEDVLIPLPWTTCLYWQWGTPTWGLLWGCESKEIDMNYFNGTAESFILRYAIEPITGEPIMEHFYLVVPLVNGETRTIRKSTYPNINGMKIGQINAYGTGKCKTGDAVVYAADVYGDGVLKAKAGDRWLHIYEANGLPIDGWIAEIHLGRKYLIVEEVGAEPVPVPDSDEIEIFVNKVLKYTIVGKLTVS
jgi:GH25 family lysozyme M1 (1,4-beta-N-acetylmuramidase)